MRPGAETGSESCMDTMIVNYRCPWEGGARPSPPGNPKGWFQDLLSPWTDPRPQANCLISLNFSFLNMECKGWTGESCLPRRWDCQVFRRPNVTPVFTPFPLSDSFIETE